MSPLSASTITAAVFSPTPGMSVSRPASARRRSSSSGTSETSRAARRKACRRYDGARPRISSSAMRSSASTGVTPGNGTGRAARGALVYSDAGGLTEWPKVLAC